LEADSRRGGRSLGEEGEVRGRFLAGAGDRGDGCGCGCDCGGNGGGGCGDRGGKRDDLPGSSSGEAPGGAMGGSPSVPGAEFEFEFEFEFERADPKSAAR